MTEWTGSLLAALGGEQKSPEAELPECHTRSISVEARSLHLLVIGLEGNVTFQQGPGLGAAVEPTPLLPLLPAQAVIDAAGADARSCRSISGVSRKWRQIQGIHSGNRAFKRTEQE
jgi:hypothetical protein